MKLRSLQIHNFRQFYGTTPKLDLRPAADGRNVIVFHGSNGSGKTAILNSLTWVLYREFTKGFQQHERLVNEKALNLADPEASVKAWVQIEFDHDSVQYKLRRTIEARSSSKDRRRPEYELPLELYYKDAVGRENKEEYPDDAIGRVLPKDLHNYFFFDGERIEQIVQASPEERKNLGKATKVLLNVELLYRAMRHLQAACGELEDDLAKVGPPEMTTLLERKSEIASRCAEIEEELTRLEEEIAKHDERREDIEDQIRSNEHGRILQKERDQLRKQLDELRSQQERNERDVRNIISTKAYSVFLSEVISEFRNHVSSKRSRGELPSGIRQEFIDDLLNEGVCICGRAITLDGPEREALSMVRRRAGHPDVEETILAMSGRVDHLESLSGESVKESLEFCVALGEFRTKVSKIEDRLQVISESLRGVQGEDVVGGLEDARKECIEEVGRAKIEIGRLEQEQRGLLEELESTKKKIDDERLKEKKQMFLANCVSVAQRSCDRVDEIIGYLEQRLRKQLQERLEQIFRLMSITPYSPSLHDDWSVRLYEEVGGIARTVAASQGESQVLCLAFIASLIEQAKSELPQLESLIGDTPGRTVEYPIIMDSPFGSLDPTHRRQVSAILPDVADQLVLLVTQSQWRGEVETTIGKTLARSYVIAYVTSRDDLRPIDIDVGGQRFPLVRSCSDEFDYSEILEVDRGVSTDS